MYLQITSLTNSINDISLLPIDHIANIGLSLIDHTKSISHSFAIFAIFLKL